MNSCRISFVSFVYFLISDFIMKIFNYLSETAVFKVVKKYSKKENREFSQKVYP